MKIIAENRKAKFDYFIETSFEAGIQLLGTEVKSIRENNVQLKEAFIVEQSGELFIKNMHIAEYRFGNINNHDPLRTRKLLLNRREIDKIIKEKQLQGYTVVPTRLYLKGQLVKIEIALGKGKKLYDKRQTIKDRDQQRAAMSRMKYK